MEEMLEEEKLIMGKMVKKRGHSCLTVAQEKRA